MRARRRTDGQSATSRMKGIRVCVSLPPRLCAIEFSSSVSSYDEELCTRGAGAGPDAGGVATLYGVRRVAALPAGRPRRPWPVARLVWRGGLDERIEISEYTENTSRFTQRKRRHIMASPAATWLGVHRLYSTRVRLTRLSAGGSSSHSRLCAPARTAPGARRGRATWKARIRSTTHG